MYFADLEKEIYRLNQRWQSLCSKVRCCLGISPDGESSLVLNQQGDWIVNGSGGFSCDSLNSCSTTNLPEGSNLYFTCARVNTCLGISPGGSATLFLNEQGDFVSVDADVTGTPTEIAYFDATTGELTSDSGFTRDTLNNGATFINGGNGLTYSNSIGLQGDGLINLTSSEIGVGDSTLSLQLNALTLQFQNAGALLSGYEASDQSLVLKNHNGVTQYTWAWPTIDGTAGQILATNADSTMSWVDGNFWSLTGNAGTDPNTNFIGTTDGEDFIIQPSTGNVGLGTITPSAKLHVGPSPTPFIGEWDNGLGVTGQIAFGTYSGGLNVSYTDVPSNTAVVYNLGGNLESLFIENTTSPATSSASLIREQSSTEFRVYNGDFTEILRVQDTGNVGIGTATPAYKLEVNGDLYAAINNQSGKFHQLVYFDANPFDKGSVYVDEAGLILTMTNAAGQNANIIQLSDGNLDIASNNDNGDITIHTTSADNVIIQGDDGATNGLVGIGIPAPTAKLHVVGSTTIDLTGNLPLTLTGVQAFDDDSAAGGGGLTAGMVYQTTGSGAAPLNVAGILMIKQ